MNRLGYAAAATVFVLVALPPSAGAAGRPGDAAALPSPRHSGVGGIVPPLTAPGFAGLVDACPCGVGNLTYHGGAVMRTNATYAIFWLPAGFSFNGADAAYEAGITRFLADVGADSGLYTNVYSTTPQYYDTLGGGTHPAAYDSTFAGSAVVTDPFPAAQRQCTDRTRAVCLLDSQLRAEIESVVAAKGWPQDGSALYFLLTPPTVGSCFDDGSGCAYSQYCAYHSSIVTGSGEILYANQPWTYAVSGCDTGQHPNDSTADPTINVLSHEHSEAVTDPNVNAPDGLHPAGWYDLAGYENGDKCAWTFGAASGTAGRLYNQTINGRHYYLQEEWNNTGGDCVQSSAPPAPPPSPPPPPQPPPPAPPAPPPPPPAPILCGVPDLHGLMLAAAQEALNGAHCLVGTTTLAFSAAVPSGRVVSQSAGAGVTLPNGAFVDLVVSKGAPPKRPPVKVTLCYRRHTIRVTRAKAKVLRRHGARLGACRKVAARR